MTRPLQAPVHMVGGGPGQPDLITVAGQRALQSAERLVVEPGLEAVVAAWAPDIEVCWARPGANEALIALRTGIEAGQRLVRLVLGDAFEPAGIEAELLAIRSAGAPVVVVPAPSQALASATFAGLPWGDLASGWSMALHVRGEGFRLGTGPEMEVMAPGGGDPRRMAHQLIKDGHRADWPVARVDRAGRPDQTVTWTELADLAHRDPQEDLSESAWIIGPTRTVDRRVPWIEARPLQGLRVVNTRGVAQKAALTRPLAALGAEVIELPTIEFASTAPGPISKALAGLSDFDQVIFTSTNGVDHFMDALDAAGLDPRAFGRARIACIGPATARRLAGRGLKADEIPEDYVAEGLIEALCPAGRDLTGTRVLIPRARVARETLPEALRAAGAEVLVLPVYETVPAKPDPACLARVVEGEVDVVVFTASSTVSHFEALLPEADRAEVRGRIQAACIGPVTARTAEGLGYSVALVAETYTIPGVVEALVRWQQA